MCVCASAAVAEAESTSMLPGQKAAPPSHRPAAIISITSHNRHFQIRLVHVMPDSAAAGLRLLTDSRTSHSDRGCISSSSSSSSCQQFCRIKGKGHSCEGITTHNTTNTQALVYQRSISEEFACTADCAVTCSSQFHSTEDACSLSCGTHRVPREHNPHHKVLCLSQL